MKSFPRPLPSPPSRCAPTCEVIRSWLRDVKAADQQQIDQVLAFLDEDYLRSVALPVGAFFASRPSACRHWFRVFTAWVLGWKCRKDEGDPGGFPTELNFHLRNYVWPDNKTPLKWWRESVKAVGVESENKHCQGLHIPFHNPQSVRLPLSPPEARKPPN